VKKDVDEISFCRVGGLSSVRQKGYDASMPTFHSPPLRRGIYAFVWPHIEFFLLSGKNSRIGSMSSKFSWLKDKEGNRIEDGKDLGEKYWTELDPKDDKWYYVKKKDMKYFEYYGEIWHHLEVRPKDVIERKGEWVKTSFDAYKKAIIKEVGSRALMKKRDGYTYSKDHLEVFIEKV